jgi:hypothetical protein
MVVGAHLKALSSPSNDHQNWVHPRAKVPAPLSAAEIAVQVKTKVVHRTLRGSRSAWIFPATLTAVAARRSGSGSSSRLSKTPMIVPVGLGSSSTRRALDLPAACTIARPTLELYRSRGL